MLYIEVIRNAGGVVNTAIVIAAATGMLLVRDPESLECNGGHIVLKKGWAKYFLQKMSCVKRKATTPSHWCNEETMLDHNAKIISPYIRQKKDELDLPESQPSLVSFDEFTSQVTDAALFMLENNNIFYVIVPPNCTDKLQPLDISINKPAKEYLRSKFQSWYASKITGQL